MRHLQLHDTQPEMGRTALGARRRAADRRRL